MKKILIAILFAIGCTFLYALESTKKGIKVGLDVLREQKFSLIRGKRVGLVTNATALATDLKHIADVFAESPDVKLVALFGPEHGVRGDVEGGAKIESYTDEKTGLPVYSLYGKNYKPSKEMLKDIDVLVYDIQDIGVRSYTYISTMGFVMEAAAENNIPFVVLDRPNPCGGNRVEGAVLDTAFRSFIGMYPVPYVYGLTVGELAQMINGEGWLRNGLKCDLKIVKMEGWTRNTYWEETERVWVPTSPHIPHSLSSLYYVLTGILGELMTVNIGVGYTMPFELVGTPWMNGFDFAKELDSRNLKGVAFTPISYAPFYTENAKKFHKGVQIHIRGKDSINLMEVAYHIIDALLKLYPDSNVIEKAGKRIQAFDRANGNAWIREEFLKRTPVTEILKRCDEQVKEFKKKRMKYLLY